MPKVPRNQTIRRLPVDARTYMEIANSPAKLFDALDRHHGMNVEHIRAGTDPDVVGNCVLRKQDQDPALKQDYRGAFELD